MSHRHLNEEDVHSIALHSIVLADRSWQDCPDCVARVQECRDLFLAISTMKAESPSFDLERVVMASLPEPVKPVHAVPQPMNAMPIWVGSLVFFLVVGMAWASFRGYFSGIGTWISALALVTVPGIAIWVMFDTIQDHRRKVRSLGLK
jgi:hypothetical protein